MKIAVTGHTAGIGKAIADRFIAEGHTVTGFSRSTGHDLSEPEMVYKVAKEAVDHDVFVNSAYSYPMGFAQINLLYAVRDLWHQDASKTIINLSSVSADGIMIDRQFYAIHKSALDKACEQLCRLSACRVMNIKPGYVDTLMTERVKGITKLKSEDIADVCMWMLTATGSYRRYIDDCTSTRSRRSDIKSL